MKNPVQSRLWATAAALTVILAAASNLAAQVTAEIFIEPYPTRLLLQQFFIDGQVATEPITEELCAPRPFTLRALLHDADEITVYCRTIDGGSGGGGGLEGFGITPGTDCHNDAAGLGDSWTVNWTLSPTSGGGWFRNPRGESASAAIGEAVVFYPSFSGLAVGQSRTTTIKIEAWNQSTNAQADDPLERMECDDLAPEVLVEVERLQTNLYRVKITPPATPTCNELTTSPPDCGHDPNAPCHATAFLDLPPNSHDAYLIDSDLPDPDLGICAGEITPLTVVFTDTDFVRGLCMGCGDDQAFPEVMDYLRYEWEVFGPGELLNSDGMTALYMAPAEAAGQTVLLRARIFNEPPNQAPITGLLHYPDIIDPIDFEYMINLADLRVDSNNDGILAPPDSLDDPDEQVEMCPPGHKVAFNGNDSDQNGETDLFEGIQGGDPDLSPMWVTINAPSADAADPAAVVRLTVDENVVRIYLNQDKTGGRIDNIDIPWSTWQLAAPTGMRQVYLEGRSAGESVITLSVTSEEKPICSDSVVVTVEAAPSMRFINGANADIPLEGDDSCLLVSTIQTDKDLPPAGQATWESTTVDLDNFRVRVKDYTNEETPKIRLAVARTGYTSEWSLVKDPNSNDYRTDTFFRLVSNGPPATQPEGSLYDDQHAAAQTVLVQLGDVVSATLLMDGQDAFAKPISVARPESESGPNAIRAARLNWLVHPGATNADPGAASSRTQEDWAQAAINLHNTAETPAPFVNNVIVIAENLSGEVSSSGVLKAALSYSDGQSQHEDAVQVQVEEEEPIVDVAGKLTDAIDALPDFAASYTFEDQPAFGRRHLVTVKPGSGKTGIQMAIALDPDENDSSIVSWFRPDLNWLEDSRLEHHEMEYWALSYKDGDPKTIDAFVVPDGTWLYVQFSGDTYGYAYGLASGGWQTVLPATRYSIFVPGTAADGVDDAFVESPAQPPSTSPWPAMPLVLGHEIGHILLETPGHVSTTSNLMHDPLSQLEQLNSTKRLDAPSQPNEPTQRAKAHGNPILEGND